MGIASLIERLHATPDVLELDRVVRKLKKCAVKERAAVIEAFLEYTRAGQVNHWRSMLMPSAIELIEKGESRYAAAFQQGLTQRKTAYWSVLGLAKCLQNGCYAELTAFALDDRNEMEARAHAVQQLAALSNQTFTRGLPTAPNDWPSDQFPRASILRWRDEGFPRGAGFTPPSVSLALATPRTEIDKLAAKLEAKLRRYRAAEQDLANPTNWLVPAAAHEIQAVTTRWPLPAAYLEFITKFSPLRVTLYGRSGGQGLALYGASELTVGQYGYSYDPRTSTTIANWQPNHVVIAAEAGNPYVLDLAATKAGDCPVLTAPHGRGAWSFSETTAKFSTFLKRLA
jgi:hypothetical protein